MIEVQMENSYQPTVLKKEDEWTFWISLCFFSTLFYHPEVWRKAYSAHTKPSFPLQNRTVWIINRNDFVSIGSHIRSQKVLSMSPLPASLCSSARPCRSWMLRWCASPCTRTASSPWEQRRGGSSWTPGGKSRLTSTSSAVNSDWNAFPPIHNPSHRKLSGKHRHSGATRRCEMCSVECKTNSSLPKNRLFSKN